MSDFVYNEDQFIIKSKGVISDKQADILYTAAYEQVVLNFISFLEKKDNPLLSVFSGRAKDARSEEMIELLRLLAENTKEDILKKHPKFKSYFDDCYSLSQFVEELYNFWRNYKRYMITYGNDELKHHNKPYRTFNNTIELLNDHVRGVYRDIVENIVGYHPRIFRQVPAGCEIGIITKEQYGSLGGVYDKLASVPIIRQILIEPPLILDPPMNKRSGRFEPVDFNPLEDIEIDPEKFICFPAKVGDLIIHVYFHLDFIGLGISMCNLFEIARSKDLRKKPDAVYVFGADPEVMEGYDHKTIFYDDKDAGMLVGCVPREDRFGYFGYVKKMVLTLHNTIQMKRGKLPIHGAMVCIKLKDGSAANVVIVGDSGAGKSESLEALRVLSDEHIRDMTLIFDDMGTFELAGDVRAYGTEVGAFVRLDDLSPGFAYGSIDRSIIMSPQKINARAIIPVTTIEEVLYGHKVDMLLYANNYEKVSKDNPSIEWFKNWKRAFEVFKKGERMAKGTTSEKGITTSYFANPFGPDQFKEMHAPIAEKFFKAFFENGVKVGIIRTQLGIEGMETRGPEDASRALFEVIRQM